MAEPIELVKGGERQTVYSEVKAAPLEAAGWMRVRDLTPEQQKELASRPPLPWRGYDDATVEDVLAKSADFDGPRRQEVIAYEKATKARKGVLAGLGAQEQPPVTVETVLEQPLQTTETVEIVPAGDAPATDQPATGGIVPQNDVPQAMNQGRLKRGVPRG